LTNCANSDILLFQWTGQLHQTEKDAEDNQMEISKEQGGRFITLPKGNN
jgi:hypothetical protein